MTVADLVGAVLVVVEALLVRAVIDVGLELRR